MGFTPSGKRGERIYRFHKSTVRHLEDFVVDLEDLPAAVQPGWATAFTEWVAVLVASDGKLIRTEQKQLAGLDYKEQQQQQQQPE